MQSVFLDNISEEKDKAVLFSLEKSEHIYHWGQMAVIKTVTTNVKSKQIKIIKKYKNFMLTKYDFSFSLKL